MTATCARSRWLGCSAACSLEGAKRSFVSVRVLAECLIKMTVVGGISFVPVPELCVDRWQVFLLVWHQTPQASTATARLSSERKPPNKLIRYRLAIPFW